MAKKQYYCIDFRNMHNAIHGLIVYNTRREAEDNYIALHNGIKEYEVSVRRGELSEDDWNRLYNNLVQKCIEDSCDFIDEVNYHDFEYCMLRGRQEKIYNPNGYKHIIVNMLSIDLYI